jgi:hypothetical protein
VQFGKSFFWGGGGCFLNSICKPLLTCPLPNSPLGFDLKIPTWSCVIDFYWRCNTYFGILVPTWFLIIDYRVFNCGHTPMTSILLALKIQSRWPLSYLIEATSSKRVSWWFELKYPQGFGCLVILMTLIVGVTSIRFLVPTQISINSFLFLMTNYVLDPLLKRSHLRWSSGELNLTSTFWKLTIKSQMLG